MKRALPAAILVLVVLAAVAVAVAPAVREPLARSPRPAASISTPELRVPAPPPLSRDPFSYVESRLPSGGPGHALDGPAGSMDASPAGPPAEPPVRLVGLVSRGGTLRAALVIRGELALLAVGEQAAGFTLRALDEDAGARVEGPDGAILQLRPR